MLDDSVPWDDLGPHNQAVFALANLIQAIGMLGAMVQASENPEYLAGFNERCRQVVDYAANQCHEISIFGDSYDPDADAS